MSDMPHVPSSRRTAGTRFRDAQQPAAHSGASHASTSRSHVRAPQPVHRAQRTQSSRVTPSAYARPQRVSAHAPHAASSHTRRLGAYAPAPRRRWPVVVGIVSVLLVVALAVIVFVFPKLAGSGSEEQMPSGQAVTLTVPAGASGDAIASLLSENHVIEDPTEYYAAVKSLKAESSLKPGDYQFTTGQDPTEVVRQLVEGPNAVGSKLTIPEGKTLEQTAELVEQACGIPAADFIAQAKASAYATDYPFVAGAYNDSLEGFLFPKTYTFGRDATADDVIRTMLDQFKLEVLPCGFEEGAHGLSAQQILAMASLIERETAVESERPLVASVIQNRLNAGMPLQIDAAIVYARGGGNSVVTYEDLKIDSPYNVYRNTGLTPGPICSPSLSSIKAAMAPASTDYLYYVASAAGDGSHKFTASDEEFEQFRQEYERSQS